MSTETTTTERAPVRLTYDLCKAMPIGTELYGIDGYWHARSYVKTTDSTWAFFDTRPSPVQIKQAIQDRRNNLSPCPSGRAFIYEPPAKPDTAPAPLDPSKAGGPFGKGDTVRRTSETPLRYAGLGIMPGRNFTVREGTEVPNGVISVEATRGVLDAALFELVTRATAHQPAPEPEPEWKPGTFAEATVHGYPGIRVWRVEGGEPRLGWTTNVPVDDATWHSDSDVTDVRPLFVLDPAATKCPECGDGLFVALHDDEQSICRTCTTREMERLELESARAAKTVVHVTKATTQEELADALARHYGDHAGLAAIVEQSTRQNYLSDARSVLAILGGGE